MLNQILEAFVPEDGPYIKERSTNVKLGGMEALLSSFRLTFKSISSTEGSTFQLRPAGNVGTVGRVDHFGGVITDAGSLICAG